MKTYSAIIIDCETTGLNAEKDFITELGLICLSFSMSNEACKILWCNSRLQELPGELDLIPKEIIKLTGITDEMIKGKKIEWGAIGNVLNSADLLISHNTEFDSAFVKKYIPEIKPPWICSRSDYPWKDFGFKSCALNYLACDHGFVNPFPHRALTDCLTTFKLLENKMPDFLRYANKVRTQISANGAAFEKKDKLRDHGFYWKPEDKVWKADVFAEDLPREEAWLRENVYGADRGRDIWGVKFIGKKYGDQLERFFNDQ